MPPQTNPPEILQEESKDSKKFKVKEILYEGNYYDVTNWVDRHPGGKIINFYTESGEDATLPIQQFHNRSIKRILTIMKTFKCRPAEIGEHGLNPETLQRHQALTKDFQKLHKDLEAEGHFKPSLFHTIYRISELAAMHLLGFYLIVYSQSLWVQLIGACLVGLCAGRCGWFMHEGGHHSITGKPKIDRIIESFALGYGDGMSASWWSSQHNRHHAMPQRLQHDVDLETVPLLAFNKKVVRDAKNGKGFFVQNQAILFLMIDAFIIMALWKFYLGPRYALKKKAYLDLFFLIVHYSVYLHYGLYFYPVIMWVASTYLIINFALSHTHTGVSDKPLHWVEYSLLHTVDIEPSWWCDWWMGYLNYQIEHHLFPTMPQFRNKEVTERVKLLAKKHNIPYQCISYWDGLMKTFQNLADVSHELKQMK